jgi:hypothetical protein
MALRAITNYSHFGQSLVFSCFHSFVSCGDFVKKQEKMGLELKGGNNGSLGIPVIAMDR